MQIWHGPMFFSKKSLRSRYPVVFGKSATYIILWALSAPDPTLKVASIELNVEKKRKQKKVFLFKVLFDFKFN